MDLLEYAALSHGGMDWSEAFAQAVAGLRRQGGGVLTVPPGDYPTGPIRLCSHMTLEIQSGATLRFLQDKRAFPMVPLEFEGIAKDLPMPCLFAEDEEFVTVTGGGAVDGQGSYWWELLKETNHKHPRPYLVCFSRCRHVTIENILLTNSPCWTVHPLRCQDVSIRDLRISNPQHSPNTDGINPDACQDVRIDGCTIDVGDDCIAIKSGTEDTPDRRPCERIIIRGCHFLHGHGGVVLGSEMSGGIRDVVVSDCIFYNTDRGVRLKTRRGRGGVVENIRLSNLTMRRVLCPFVFNMYYSGFNHTEPQYVWDKAPYPVNESTPCLRDVSITGVVAKECTACAGYFHGLAEMPVQGIVLRDVLVEMTDAGEPDYPAMVDDCPKMQGAGLFLRNARDVDLSGLKLLNVRGEPRDIDESVSMVF